MISRKTTKEILGESLHELSEQKSVDKITVKEIVANCDISSATFYRYFHDKYELIEWMFTYQMEDIFMDFCDGAETWQQVLTDILTILEEDKNFYKNALWNTEGQNSIFRSAHQRSRELLCGLIRTTAFCKAEEEVLFDLDFYLRGASYIIRDWCVNDLPYSVEALTDYLYNAMPEKLKPFMS